MTPYQISEELYVQAMTYAQQRTKTIIIGVCLVVPMAIYVIKGFDRQVMASVLLVYMILAFYFLMLAPMINRINYKRHYRKNPLLHKTQHFEISDSEILFKSENGESRYPLAEIKRLLIFPELILFYPTTTIFHVIPRDALQDSEFEIISRHVRQ